MSLSCYSAWRVPVATANCELKLRANKIVAELGCSVQWAEIGSEILAILLSSNPLEIAFLDAAIPGLSVSNSLRRSNFELPKSIRGSCFSAVRPIWLLWPPRPMPESMT
jgi:hypothetical protein